MASKPTHQQAETPPPATVVPNAGPDWASRRKLLLTIGGMLSGVFIYFGVLTLLSSTRWLDFAPATGTISAAPERVAQVAQFSTGAARITQMDLSPDGALAATVSAGRPGVTVYAVADGTPRYTLDAGTDVLACIFSPDSKTIVTANSQQQIQVWSSANGQLRYPPLAGQQQLSVALRVTSDGQRLLSAGRDGMIVIWQLGDGRQMRISTGKLPAIGSSPATFSEDGAVLAYGNATTGITIFSLDTEEIRNVIDSPTSRTAFAGLTFSHSGALLVARDASGKLEVFRAATGELVRTLTWTGAGDSSPRGPVQVGAFNADARLFAIGGRDGNIELWEVESGTLRAKLAGQAQSPINALDFSADGRTMVSASDNGRVRLWRVR